VRPVVDRRLPTICVSFVVVPLRSPSRRLPPVLAAANGVMQMTRTAVAATTERVRGARPRRRRRLAA
jgi:hypothetical protein